MRKTIAAFLALAAIALLAGCAAAGAQGAAAAPTLAPEHAALAPAGPTLGALREGDLLVWLGSKPERPEVGAAQMDAYLVGTDGRPISDAKVSFDTDMTNMSHGPYLVEAQPSGEGHYGAQIRFSMPGPWRVIVVVERPGHETAKLRFRFSVGQ